MYAIKHHGAKMYGGLEVQSHTFLSPAADGGDALIHSPIAYPSDKSLLLRRWVWDIGGMIVTG